MKKKLTSVKNFVYDNRGKILATTSVFGIAGTIVMRSGIHQHNEFLREKGLYEEFYALVEEV